MNGKWRRVLVVVLASAFFGLGITTNAFSATANTESGYSQIDWTSLEVSGPIAYGNLFDRAYAYATLGSTFTDGPREGSNVSATAVVGAYPLGDHAYAKAETTFGNLRVDYSGSVVSGTNEENGAAGRLLGFEATGPGLVTISVDYSLSYGISSLPGGSATSSNFAGLFYILDGGSPGYAWDWIGDTVANGASGSDNKNGTLTLSFLVTGNSYGYFGAGVGDPDVLYAWGSAPANVPLPGAILLLAPGLAGIALLRRRLSH